MKEISGDMSRVQWQRCFQIPKPKLNLFLVKIGMEQSKYSYFEADWVFDCQTHYDVVVSERGVQHYGFASRNVEEFATRL